MQPQTVFFVGKPGSGKGDQTKLLAKATGWRIIGSGDQFRALAQEDTPAGKKTKEEMNAGFLAPHWFAMYLFLKSLFSLREDESVIFDGFSRKIPEAELAQDALAWLNRPFVALHLKVSDAEIKHRLELRKNIEGRVDDNAVDERLKEFREYTEPVIEMFREKGKLVEVDGEREREPIAADILKALNIGTS